MAKQTGNVVTYGLSGKIGDLLVFRRKDGKTIVSKVPEITLGRNPERSAG